MYAPFLELAMQHFCNFLPCPLKVAGNGKCGDIDVNSSMSACEVAVSLINCLRGLLYDTSLHHRRYDYTTVCSEKDAYTSMTTFQIKNHT